MKTYTKENTDIYIISINNIEYYFIYNKFLDKINILDMTTTEILYTFNNEKDYNKYIENKNIEYKNLL